MDRHDDAEGENVAAMVAGEANASGGDGGEDLAVPAWSAGEEGTQLEQRAPQVDTPLRIKPPASIKAPARTGELTWEEQIWASAFSPAAYTMRKYEVPGAATATNAQQSSTMSLVSASTGATATNTTAVGGAAALAKELRQKEAATVKTHSENQAPYRTAMSDYSMLAFSSQRSGRAQMEGVAHFSMGVVADNMQQFGRALECYRRFLAVCRRTRDGVAEALCYNCMGVACMHAAALMPTARELLQASAEHNRDHLRVAVAAADAGGQFVAHTNLGLCLGQLGDAAAAARHHQAALRAALAVQSVDAQRIAVGNLGLLALRIGDHSLAGSCLEQHLQLVQAVRDTPAEVHALSLLGELAGAAGDHAQALRCFEGARRLACQQGEASTLKRLHCNMGVARGKLSADEYFDGLRRFAEAGYS